MKKLLVLSLSLLVTFTAISQENKATWKFDGQVQLRSEMDGRDFSNKTHPYFYSSLRTRLGASANIADKFLFYAQAQDSRIMGEETSISTNTKNLDLHQGYVKLVDPFELPLTVQAGRFEISYGTERFLSSSQWNYTAKAWDGVRFQYSKSFKLDVFALTKSDSAAYVSNFSPTTSSYPAKNVYSASLYGFWFTTQLDQANKLDVFSYYDISRKYDAKNNPDLKQGTYGLNHTGSYGILSSLTEAAYQYGKKGVKDVSAFTVSAQGFLKVWTGKVGIGADVMSGTDPNSTTDFNTFDLSYGGPHKRNGLMDYFYESYSATYGLGLNDYYVTSAFDVPNTALNIALDLHILKSNKAKVNYGTDLGQEIDLTLKYNLIKEATLSWGGSVFLPGDLMKSYFKTAKGDRSDMGFWSYVMITANF
jgi:hypothetical protein